VIFHGRLSEAIDAAAATREALGLLMGGSADKGSSEAVVGKDRGHAAGA
jgi:hypothetical protein